MPSRVQLFPAWEDDSRGRAVVTEGSGGRFVADDGVTIAYQTWGGVRDLPPVVLHHGFTGDSLRDWVEPGVVDALVAAGRTVVTPDARGHGRSGKPHRPDSYGESRMATDVSRLIDALAEDRVDLVGFSMGAVVALLAATREPRIRRLVTVGVGAAVVERGGVDADALQPGSLAEALVAEDPASVSDPRARVFVDGLRGRDVDREALALHARSAHAEHIALERISAPTLILAGDGDPFARRPEVLAAAVPGAQLEVIHGDHGTCITNPRFTEAVIEFLTA